jgi:hypothetical protein
VLLLYFIVDARMPANPSPDPKFNIGHVLFIDIVGYSKLLVAQPYQVIMAAPIAHQRAE